MYIMFLNSVEDYPSERFCIQYGWNPGLVYGGTTPKDKFTALTSGVWFSFFLMETFTEENLGVCEMHWRALYVTRRGKETCSAVPRWILIFLPVQDNNGSLLLWVTSPVFCIGRVVFARGFSDWSGCVPLRYQSPVKWQEVRAMKGLLSIDDTWGSLIGISLIFSSLYSENRGFSV